MRIYKFKSVKLGLSLIKKHRGIDGNFEAADFTYHDNATDEREFFLALRLCERFVVTLKRIIF